MTHSTPKKIVIYGNKDKSGLGFPTVEKLLRYMREGVFSKEAGRYRFTQNKDAHVIVMCRDAMLYGHFDIVGRVKPISRDFEAWPKVKSVYLVSASTVYSQPVPLTKVADPKIRFGKFISEATFQKLISLAGETTKTERADIARERELADDLEAIYREPNTNPTTRKALVNARLGQGRFRTDVLAMWDGCCAVSGATTLVAIRASHIKPWRSSTNAERLDPRNGLPLVASLDALFDAGLISFDNAGAIKVSPKLNRAEQRIFDLTDRALFKKPSKATALYLAHHCTERFKAQ